MRPTPNLFLSATLFLSGVWSGGVELLKFSFVLFLVDESFWSTETMFFYFKSLRIHWNDRVIYYQCFVWFSRDDLQQSVHSSESNSSKLARIRSAYTHTHARTQLDAQCDTSVMTFLSPHTQHTHIQPPPAPVQIVRGPTLDPVPL